MATYTDVYGLHNNAEMRNRVAVACIVAAEVIHGEDPATENHANRLLWAASALSNPQSVATQMWWALLATYNAVSVETILAATDEQIQDAVEAHIDLFATGG